MARAETERLADGLQKQSYYAGRWRAGHGGAAFDVVDPVTERCLATVAEAGPYGPADGELYGARAGGVVAAITPWNSPTMIAAWKIAPALAADGVAVGIFANQGEVCAAGSRILVASRSEQIRAGAVAVNGWSPLDLALPWGGTRLSGHGRDLGWAGIEANTEEKTVTVVL